MARGSGFIQQPDKHINGPAGQLVPKKRPPARGTGEGGEHGLDSDGATIDDEREHSSAVQRNKTLLKAKTPPSTQKFTQPRCKFRARPSCTSTLVRKIGRASCRERVCQYV